MEAKYRALANATCELQWLTHLLDDFGIVYTQPTLLFYDNRYALHIAAYPVFHERTKHIEIDCHIVREKLHSGLIKLLPIAFAQQLANIYTKALPRGTFNFLQCKLECQIYILRLEEGY